MKEKIIEILNEFKCELFEKEDDGYHVEAVKESDFETIAEKIEQIIQLERDELPEPMEDEFEPCAGCDGHPACEDFGCAIKAGIIEDGRF